MEVLNDKELLIVHDVIQNLKVIDIDTLQVTREFQGFLPSRKWSFKLLEKRDGNKSLYFPEQNYNICCLMCNLRAYMINIISLVESSREIFKHYKL